MTRFTESEIEEVRSRADIVEVIGAHVRLRRAGRNFVGLCPFHNEKTPSFSVSLERGFFHCFGCGVGGTVFDFLTRTEGLTFPEALQSLARRYGITLPERTADNGTMRNPASGDRASMFAANQLAAEFYANVLWNTSDGELARDYLKTRGITGETARAFMLGFAPQRASNVIAVLQKRGLLEAALKLGLAKKDQSGTAYDMFRARLMFPIRDAQGRVIAFGGRVLDNRLPKYINSAESPLYSKARALYGLAEARPTISKADRVIVVEGYIDVIALSQAGFKETVATLGTALTIEQLRLLSRYTHKILACFDGDDAGRKASLRALEVFLQAGLLGRGVFIPQGYDPDTLVHERGAHHFNDLLTHSELLIEMFLRQQAQIAPKGRAAIDDRARVLASIGDKLRLIKDEIQFNLLVRKAVDLVGFTDREEAVLRQAGRRSSAIGGARQSTTGQRGGIPSAPRTTPSPDALVQAELGLIALALHYPDLRPELKSRLRQYVFSDEGIGSLLEEICATNRSSGTSEVVISSRLDEQRRGWLSGIMVGSLMDDAAKANLLMEDYLNALSEGRRRREVAQLRHAAMTANGDEAVAAAQAVIVARRRGADRQAAH
ncbi:MAG: DNA primase [Deltaproteobacteria bacterium]|nr:DNA primase [Deltaproteobacteria bacterium]